MVLLTKHCVQNVCIIGRPTRLRLVICSAMASLLKGTNSVDNVTFFMGLPYWRLHSMGSWLSDWTSRSFKFSNNSLSPASVMWRTIKTTVRWAKLCWNYTTYMWSEACDQISEVNQWTSVSQWWSLLGSHAISVQHIIVKL